MLMLIVVISSGCASIFCGADKTINISSIPKGANFSIRNRKGNIIEQGITPTNVSLKRGSGWFKAGDYTLSMSKAGFTTTNQKIEQGLEGWYFGNIIFGGLIGMVIVDPLTGGMYTLDDIELELSPEKQSDMLKSQIKNLYKNIPQPKIE